MIVEELESAVSRLSAEEFARFSEWFEQFKGDRWDRQIEEDVKVGRLDAAGERADEDFEAGRCTPLRPDSRETLTDLTCHRVVDRTRKFDPWRS